MNWDLKAIRISLTALGISVSGCADYGQLMPSEQTSLISKHIRYLRPHITQLYADLDVNGKAGALVLIPRLVSPHSDLSTLPAPKLMFGDSPLDAVRSNLTQSEISTSRKLKEISERSTLCLFVSRATDPNPVRAIHCSEIFYQVMVERLVAARFDEVRANFVAVNKDMDYQATVLGELNAVLEALRSRSVMLSESVSQSTIAIRKDILDNAEFKNKIIERLDKIQQKLDKS